MRVFSFCMFAGCLLLLAYGLFRPAPPPDLFAGSDKLWHVLAFGALSVAARIAFLRAPGWLLWGALLVVALLAEWLQYQLQPVRQFSWQDVSANLAGVLLAFPGWRVLVRLWR